MLATEFSRIHVIFTGGTIAGVSKDRIDWKDYRAGQLSGDALLESLPEAGRIAKISKEQSGNFSSSSLQPNQWNDLHQRVVMAVNSKSVRGVVITHGTNTLEETAYFLHLTVKTRKPVVLVGAQRPFTALSSDAPQNLLNAIRVANSDEACGKGVLVVLNDEISSAREATKTNTYRLEGFQSGQLGLLGFVDPDHAVSFYRQPTRRHTYKSALATDRSLSNLPQAAILYSHVGSSADLVDVVNKSGHYAGIVVAGTGGGHVSDQEAQALRRASSSGLPIIRASRTGNGRVIRLERPSWEECITADNLSPQKAAILFRVAMSVNPEGFSLQMLFDTH